MPWRFAALLEAADEEGRLVQEAEMKHEPCGALHEDWVIPVVLQQVRGVRDIPLGEVGSVLLKLFANACCLCLATTLVNDILDVSRVFSWVVRVIAAVLLIQVATPVDSGRARRMELLSHSRRHAQARADYHQQARLEHDQATILRQRRRRRAIL